MYIRARASTEQLVRANIFQSSQPNYFLNMRAYWSPPLLVVLGWLPTKTKMIIVILFVVCKHIIREITYMRARGAANTTNITHTRARTGTLLLPSRERRVPNLPTYVDSKSNRRCHLTVISGARASTFHQLFRVCRL